MCFCEIHHSLCETDVQVTCDFCVSMFIHRFVIEVGLTIVVEACWEALSMTLKAVGLLNLTSRWQASSTNAEVIFDIIMIGGYLAKES